ncbi:MAG: MMPL family transporter, partial [archaeon]|nr:MMPL family transporter [archaeon]
MFSKTADFIIKHSKLMIVVWIVVLICALPFGMKSSDVLEYDLTAMTGDDMESGKGQSIMNEEFSNSIDMSEILVVCYDDRADLNSEKASYFIGKVSEKVSEKYDNQISLTVVGQYSKGHGTGVYLASFSTSSKDVSLLNETGNIRELIKDVKQTQSLDFTTYVTGNDALTFDTMASAEEDISKVDPVSIILIFVLIGLFFYALVTALVPPVGVGVAYGIVLLLMYIIGNCIGIYYLTQTLVLVTMLGAGCDYGIFIITRYRDERKHGKDHEKALKTAIEWAGESVFTSGLSVIIGFGCLAICDFMMVRTMGIILALGIVVALLAALTFVPSIVNILGDRIFMPTKVEKYTEVDKGRGTGLYAALCRFSKNYFSWVAGLTSKHPIAITMVAVMICIPTGFIYATTDESYDMISVEPDAEARDGLDAIMAETYGGTLMPTYIVLELNSSAIGDMGVIPLGGTDFLPYLVWSPEALTLTSGMPSGYVPSIMMLNQKIESDHGGIVAASSGLNSWYCLYLSVATKLGYDVTSMTAEQSVNVNTVIYNTLGQLSTSLQESVGKVLTAASRGPVWYAGPNTPLDLNGHTLSNVMDFVINIGPGILSDNGNYVSIMVITSERPMSDNTMSFIEKLHTKFHDGDTCYDKAFSGVWKTSYISGTSAVMDDVSNTVVEQFQLIQAIVIVLLVVLLFLILGCYLTPIRAIVNIMMSVIWTVALTHIVFEELLNIPVCWIVPIVLFVVLLGLGMDYDIFMTTRIREYKVKGFSDDDAISNAICSAGSTITLCALIMGGTFLTLLIANSSMLQEFGFALGVGILIDGLFMVSFVAPSIMHLMGEWSWKG